MPIALICDIDSARTILQSFNRVNHGSDKNALRMEVDTGLSLRP